MRRPRVLLFDVNETLLELTPLRKSVAEALEGRNDLVPLWFTTTLHYSLIATVADAYENFDAIAAASLRMVAATHDMDLTRSEAETALAPIRTSPPHPDAVEALSTLHEAGYTLATLTNSPVRTLRAQLDHTDLARFFDRSLSVETINMYKPHRHVYRWAARQLDADADQCMMIAAHAWDVAGAAHAGLRTAFIARPGQSRFELAPSVDVQAPTLTALADRLINDAEKPA